MNQWEIINHPLWGNLKDEITHQIDDQAYYLAMLLVQGNTITIRGVPNVERPEAIYFEVCGYKVDADTIEWLKRFLPRYNDTGGLEITASTQQEITLRVCIWSKGGK
jgi:hypothetical protein